MDDGGGHWQEWSPTKTPIMKHGIGNTLCPASANCACPACEAVCVVLPLMKET